MTETETNALSASDASWLTRHAGSVHGGTTSASSAPKVLVFRALQLGDMLCAVPALRALRAALPSARITLTGLPWATQFASRFSRYVDDFVVFPGHEDFPEQAVQQHQLADFYTGMRARAFDIALQLHGSGEQSNPVVRAFAPRAMAGFGSNASGASDYIAPFPREGAEPERLLSLVVALGAPSRGTQLEFPLGDADERELGASGVAGGLAPGSYFCIHPGARWRDKCWPAASFAQVADNLARATGLKTVLTGSASEAALTAEVAALMRTPAIDAAAPISIGAMAALMSRSRLLVCNDTGVSHIAAGLGLPSVVIFSKADMQRWAPIDQQRHRCLWDPKGGHVAKVLDQAHALLAAH